MEGDDVGRWVLEFLLRNPLPLADNNKNKNNNLIKNVLRKIPVSDADSRLKKILLLKTIQDLLSTLSITESLLKTLELLEELFRRDASPVTASMSAAYCAVAVECTLKYLRVNLHNHNPAYLRAVSRIWRARVQHMNRSSSGEGSLLLSAELERWRSDIEASLSDSQVKKRLASIDTKRDAVVKLKAFLAEAWAELGPSFLQLAASMHMKEAQQHLEGEIQECSRGAAEKVHLSTTIEMEKVGDCSSVEVRKLDKNSLLNSFEANEEAPVEKQGREAPIEKQSRETPIEKQSRETPIEKQSRETPIEKQSREADVPCSHDINNNEADPMKKDQTSVPQNCDRRPSLMEKSNTTRTYEWDDSIGLEGGPSNNASKFNLPTPSRRTLSPLKIYKPTCITKRRRGKKWSKLEEETLKTCVDKFGKGNWKLILNSHKDVFEERTEVDLKDKWRNMTRYGCG